MNARRLAAHSPRAVRDLLRRHGWDDNRADNAAGSLGPVLVLLEGIAADAIEGLIRHNTKLGLNTLTGEGWVLLAGSRSRFAAFSRPWTLPPDIVALGSMIGGVLDAGTDEVPSWRHARGALRLDRPILMGILNITPDSFSDGGRFAGPGDALAHATRLLESGADLVDVGGESTRPGAQPVSEAEERSRVLPVMEALVREHPGVLVSVDTVKGGVAKAALDAGAAIVNDVSGLRLDPGLGGVVARAGAGLVVMHSRGGVADMASTELADNGDDPVGSIIEELNGSLESAAAAGVSPENIVIDPGLGFSKTAEQSLLVLDQLASFGALGPPVLVGPSRKRFLGVATGRPVEDRDRATATACVMAYERGARIFRVHNVAMAREALALAHAVHGS